MRHVATWLPPALVTASTVVPQTVPGDLSALAAKARLSTPVVAWCRGEFQRGHRGAYALAVAASAAGGRYLVVDEDATVTELASFTNKPDLTCYTPVEARKLDASIHRSDTIHGTIAPRWRTTVVCAFTDNTASVCWQFSPDDRTFVRVGGWST